MNKKKLKNKKKRLYHDITTQWKWEIITNQKKKKTIKALKKLVN